MFSFRVQWRDVTLYGIGLSLVFTTVVLLSYAIEPRVWSTDFPPEVQQKLGPLPEGAMQIGVAVFLLIMVSMLAAPLLLARRLRALSNPQSTFRSVFLHAFLVLLVLNVWDFLVIDLFIFSVLQPAFMMIHEAKEWLVEHVTMAFHIEAFLVGVPIMAVVALVASGLSMLIFRPPADVASAA